MRVVNKLPRKLTDDEVAALRAFSSGRRKWWKADLEYCRVAGYVEGVTADQSRLILGVLARLTPSELDSLRI